MDTLSVADALGETSVQWIGIAGTILGAAVGSGLVILGGYLSDRRRERRAWEPHSQLLWKERVELWEEIVQTCHACISTALRGSVGYSKTPSKSAEDYLDDIYYLGVRALLLLDEESTKLLNIIEIHCMFLQSGGREGAGMKEHREEELRATYKRLVEKARESVGVEKLDIEMKELFKPSSYRDPETK